MRTKESIKTELRARIDAMPVIDAHEHLRTEEVHLQTNFSFFHLFVPYIMYDLYAAGMPEAWLHTRPAGEQEIDDRWRAISPIWNYVKHGSYARPMRLALREFWGIEDITDDNYREIGELLNATRKPGHYREVLVEKCGIRWVLNQIGVYSHQEPFMKGEFSVDHYLRPQAIRSFVESAGSQASLDDYCAHVKTELKAAKDAGAVQAKFDVSHSFCYPLGTGRAVAEFDAIKNDPTADRLEALAAHISDELLSYMPETGLVAAVHTGVWHDIRDQSPEHLYPVVAKHPEVIFDIYHMGIPYVHECGFLGKNYQNVYLNLCWSHIVAPEMVVRALGEWLDYIPTNKVFGFGGDFLYNPEQVWGHLQVAKENLSEVFARKVEQGIFDIDTAEGILRLWLWENPARVYRLE